MHGAYQSINAIPTQQFNNYQINSSNGSGSSNSNSNSNDTVASNIYQQKHAQEKTTKLGVTQAIRDKLNFYDDRLWKRFSARRLELIDTLDLSSRKASEQERDIRRVAETLRIEFLYGPAYVDDFDKLVRAAVQSVRRNRKRSHKKVDGSGGGSGSSSPIVSDGTTNGGGKHNGNVQKKAKLGKESNNNSASQESKFLSEIVQNEEDVYDVNYDRSKRYTPNDGAKLTIDILTKPTLPPLSNLMLRKDDVTDAAKMSIMNKIERSKTCNDTLTDRRTHSLQILGKLIMAACIAYVFEISFENINEQSLEYLRNKFSQEKTLAKFFRELDPKMAHVIHDEVAVISLYTLLGGIVKDFGFDEVIKPLAEILHTSIVREYPLLSKHSSLALNVVRESASSLSDLAEVATKLQTSCEVGSVSRSMNNSVNNSMCSVHEDSQKHAYNIQTRTPTPTPPLTSTRSSSTIALSDLHEQQQHKKQVIVRFLNRCLEFLYPAINSATPRLHELVENIKAALKLNDVVLDVRHKDKLIQTDMELERAFRGDGHVVELFVTTRISVPIQFFSGHATNNHRTISGLNRGAGGHSSSSTSTTTTTTTSSGSTFPLNHLQRVILPPPVVDGSFEGAVPAPITRYNFMQLTDSLPSNHAHTIPKFEPLL